MKKKHWSVTLRCLYVNSDSKRLTDVTYYVCADQSGDAIAKALSWLPKGKFRLAPQERIQVDRLNPTLRFIRGYDDCYIGTFRVDAYNVFTVEKVEHDTYAPTYLMDGRNEDRVDGYVGPVSPGHSTPWNAFRKALEYFQVRVNDVTKLETEAA